MKKRYQNRFIVNSAKTERCRRSLIPTMQRLLNKHENEFTKTLKNFVPFNVPNGFYPCGSLVEKI